MSTPPGHTYTSGVYFARAGRYVKIGYSSRPAERVMHLLTRGGITCPPDIDRTQRPELLQVITDCRVRDERIIHGLFARHHVVGEWFELSPSFLHQMANLQYQTDHARSKQRMALKRAAKAARAANLPKPVAA